jgi:DNA modification methylase
LAAIHCSDLPLQKWRDGVIGIKDFSGDLIRAHEKRGWVLHSKVTIWKCPVVEMTRTKAKGLLYAELLKDSVQSRQGMPDYLLIMRAPGVNAEKVGHKPADLPLSVWQEWAEPVWMDIRQTNTLNVELSRDSKDQRHVCPLQLDLIQRAVLLWSNPGDVVLSPFMGIGSEGYGSLREKRRFIGIELKPEYFKVACRNLDAAERNAPVLFDQMDAA